MSIMVKLLSGLVLLLLIISHFVSADNSDLEMPTTREVNEDAVLTVPELIAKYGYPVEVHHVVSKDGYILEMHRIPHGKANSSGPAPNKSMVFVQHGLLASSADWIIAGPKKGLGYLLADLGYDVWMGNSRGNTYSRNHKSISPSTSEFWDFSWHENGVYDLPAMIDYALKHSGQTKTFYIGHSQGNTAFYVMCSEKPEYNSKIRAQFSMAPIAFMNHLYSPILRFMTLLQTPALLRLIGVDEFMPNFGFMAQFGDIMCSESSLTQSSCSNSIFMLCGFSEKQMNTELLPVIMGHSPAGSSTKQILHYAQLVNLTIGKFRKFDYGAKNIWKYKKPTPPSYNLKKVTTPVALFYSQNDWLAAETDVLKLYNKLPNTIGRFLVADKNFNHLDYQWGKEADTLIYNKIFNLMVRF